ncbi:MAG: tetratricopeptide repeat protein [bacterium]
MKLEQQYEHACQLMRSGDLAEAERQFKQLLQQSPDEPRFLAGVCNIALIQGDPFAAKPLLERLLELAPDNPQVRRQLSMVHNNLGNQYSVAQDIPSAESDFRRAVELDPGNHLAWYNLGVLLKRTNAQQESIDALNKAIALQPDNPEYLIALARAQLVNNPDNARHLLNTLLNRIPEPTSLRLAILELVANLQGKEAALNFLQIYIESRGEPDKEDLPYYAQLLERLKLLDESIAISRRALNINPEQTALQQDLAWRLNQSGKHEESVSEYQALYENDHDRLYPLIASKLILPGVYQDKAHLRKARDNYEKGLTDLESAIGHKPLDAASDLEDISWSNFYLAYQGENDRELQKRYGKLLTGLTRHWQEVPVTKPHRTKPRILIISSFLRDCTVGHYFLSWLPALVEAGYEVIPIQLSPVEDWLTKQMENICGQLISARGKIAEKLNLIRGLKADAILYPELGMDATTYLLASIRLAPLQLCAWGHPSTTGLPNIDFYISCREMEPEDAQSHYSESLLMLPGIGTAYRAANTDRRKTRKDFGLPSNKTLILYPHAPFKVHPDNDELIASVLARNPDTLLIMCEGGNPAFGRLLFDRLSNTLLAHGIDAGQRIKRMPHMSRDDFLSLNQCCDLMLDCQHWSGGNTSLDALATGLPIVTLPSHYMRGRQSSVMLQTLGCEELVCHDITTLTDKVSEIASDQELRLQLRNRIQSHQGALFDRKEGPSTLVNLINDRI